MHDPIADWCKTCFENMLERTNTLRGSESFQRNVKKIIKEGKSTLQRRRSPMRDFQLAEMKKKLKPAYNAFNALQESIPQDGMEKQHERTLVSGLKSAIECAELRKREEPPPNFYLDFLHPLRVTQDNIPLWKASGVANIKAVMKSQHRTKQYLKLFGSVCLKKKDEFERAGRELPKPWQEVWDLLRKIERAKDPLDCIPKNLRAKYENARNPCAKYKRDMDLKEHKRIHGIDK